MRAALPLEADVLHQLEHAFRDIPARGTVSSRGSRAGQPGAVL
jgi:hypothetical protein